MIVNLTELVSFFWFEFGFGSKKLARGGFRQERRIAPGGLRRALACDQYYIPAAATNRSAAQ
jgi:hypothetical protein